MKKAILFLMTILYCGIAHSATLTPNNVPKVNTGGSTPKTEDSSIWNQGSNVGIGTTDPQYSLDVAGDINAVTDITVNGTSVCLSDATNCPPFLNGWTDGGSQVYLTNSADNVGIGTINPQAKLHVKGGIIADGSFSGMLLGNNMKIDGDTTRKMTFSQTAGTYNENVRFDLDTTTNTLAVDSTTGVTDIDMSPFTVTASAFVGDGSGLTGISGGSGGVGIGTTGWMPYYAANGSNVVASNNIQLVGANVGIGTSTASQKLTVTGNQIINSTGALYFGDTSKFLVASATTNGNIDFYTASSLKRMSIQNGGSVVINDDSTNDIVPFRVETNTDANALYADGATDNIGIGTVGPVSKLQVNGTVTAIAFSGDGSALTGISSSGGGWQDGGTNVYLTATSDNVAIGTTTPTQKLTVVGTVSATSFVGDGSALTGIGAGGWTDGGTNVYTTATTDNVGIGTTTPSTTIEIVKQSSQHPLMVSSTATGDGDYLIVRSSGNVGIGTTIPLTGVAVRGSPVTLFSVTSTGTSGSSSGAGIQGYVDDGAAVVQGDRLAFYTFGGSADTGDTMLNGGAITGFANGTYSATSAPTELRFETAPAGSTTRAVNMIIKDTGLVGIGTQQPTGALNVVGDELRVGSGGTNTNATSAGELYVQGDLEADGTVYANVTGALTGNADTVTTNANLTGDVTSSGNATTLSSTYKGWSDGGASITTTTTTDTVGIGTTTVADGILQIGGDNVAIGIGGTNTTATGAGELYVKGDLEVDGTITGDGSGISGLSSGGWTDNGASIILTTTADQVAIGTTMPVAGYALTVLGGIAGSGSGPLSITNGNVGIGTFATPTVLLHVGNTAGTPTSVGANDVYIQNDLEVDGTVYMGSCSGAGCGSGSGGVGIGTTGWMPYYAADGSNVVASSSIQIVSGNVGIGTSTPSALFEVKGSGNNIFNATSGNVGIGTTLPTGKLVVQGGGIRIENTTASCIMLRDTDDAGWTECCALNGSMSCSTDADGVIDGS